MAWTQSRTGCRRAGSHAQVAQRSQGEAQAVVRQARRSRMRSQIRPIRPRRQQGELSHTTGAGAQAQPGGPEPQSARLESGRAVNAHKAPTLKMALFMAGPPCNLGVVPVVARVGPRQPGRAHSEPLQRYPSRKRAKGFRPAPHTRSSPEPIVRSALPVRLRPLVPSRPFTGRLVNPRGDAGRKVAPASLPGANGLLGRGPARTID